MAAITFLGVFYIVFLVGMLVLYFTNLVKSDIWLQGIVLMTFLAIFINMIPFVMHQTNFDIGNPNHFQRIALGDVNIQNFVETGQESVQKDNFHVFSFDNIDSREVSLFENTNFCFLYNNSDSGNNVVIVVDSVNTISNNIYLKGNTSDTSCIQINTSLVSKGKNLGLQCIDCTPSNPLKFQRGGTINVSEINIDKDNATNYNITSITPHIFFIETQILPIKMINTNFLRLLFFIGIFALIFIMRLVYVITQRGVDYSD